MPDAATRSQQRKRFRLTHERRQRLTLQLGVVCAVLCAAIMLWQSESTHARIARVVAEVQNIDAARATVSTLLSNVTHAEYEQRRYVLTNGESSLAAYREDSRQIDQRLQALETQTPPLVAESEAMLDFKHELAEQVGAMALTVRLASDGQFEAAQHIVDSDASITQMQQLRQQADQLMDRAAELVADRNTELRRLVALSRAGLIVGVLAAVFAFFLYVRQTRALQQADARQQRLLEAERDVLESQVKERTARLTELATYLQQAVEEERARLARELHDELGALLTAAKLDVARLKSKLPATATEPLERIGHLTETLNQGIALKRQIIEDLRPSSLSHLGLVAALEILAREFSKRSETPVHTDIEPVNLDENSELTIYRLVQEALTNIGKYAKATEITVTLTSYTHYAEVAVTDNGMGFDLAQIPSSSHGLMGMRHRVEALGGRLDIQTVPGHGTRITGAIPRQQAQPQPAATEVPDAVPVQV
ncbi:MAG: CHASE3 domain-containing protein [Burkholderiaceae bacterium]|jgi:signal transduction histidine kinase|nr:CHASE3 domain-containing protein [Burkholderiaceae bacterium]